MSLGEHARHVSRACVLVCTHRRSSTKSSAFLSTTNWWDGVCVRRLDPLDWTPDGSSGGRVERGSRFLRGGEERSVHYVTFENFK